MGKRHLVKEDVTIQNKGWLFEIIISLLIIPLLQVLGRLGPSFPVSRMLHVTPSP